MVHRHRQQVGFLDVGIGRRHAGEQKRAEAVVGQLRSLGYAGGAGSEHDHSGGILVVLREVELVRISVGQQIVVVVAPIQSGRVQHHDALRWNRTVRRRQRQVAFTQEKQSRFHDGQHDGQFVFLGPEVDGDVNGVELGGGKVDFHQVVAIGLHCRHAVAGFDAQLRHSVGEPVDPFLEHLETDLLTIEYDSRPIRHDCRRDHQKFRSVHRLSMLTIIPASYATALSVSEYHRWTPKTPIVAAQFATHRPT